MYLARRLFLAVPTVLGVLLAVFLLIRLVPGDVVTQLIGLEATISPKRVDELRRLFGLDRSLPVQFAEYAGGTVPMVFLFHSTQFEAVRRTVRGFEHWPNTSYLGLRRAWMAR